MAAGFSLAALLSPLSVAEFRARFWTRQPYLRHFSLPQLRKIVTGLRFADVSELLADSQAENVKLWTKLADAATEFSAPVAEAYAHYRAGKTLSFARKDPLVRAWLAGLERELELTPSLDGSARYGAVFASPGQAGAEMHFDRYDILSIQLGGTKRWWVAPPKVPFPTTTWGVGDVYGPSFDARAYRDGFMLPERRDMQKISVRPGSVFYLPRGWWHETEADRGEGSTCLNFAFSPPTRTDTLTTLARVGFEESAALRQWSESSPRRLAAEKKKLIAALRSLANDAPALVDDFFGAPYRRGQPVRRNRLTSITFADEVEGEHNTIVVHRGAKLKQYTLRLSPEGAAICRYLVAQPERITVADTMKRIPGVQKSEVEALLEAFVTVRLATGLDR